jgi:hypothetical protein
MSLSGVNNINYVQNLINPNGTFTSIQNQYTSLHSIVNLSSSVTCSSNNALLPAAFNIASINNSSSVNGGLQSSKQNFNSSTLKLLHRLLEEASQTGDLILNNKNLNEFPSKIAVSYDLSDTITAGKIMLFYL